MAELVTFSVEGTESVDRAYATIRDGVDQLQGTWATIGGLASGAARVAAPKRSGLLTASIGSRAQGDQVILTAGAIYAGVQEWGWRRRNIPPTRYLYRGITGAQRLIAEAYAAGLEGLVAQAQRGG